MKTECRLVAVIFFCSLAIMPALADTAAPITITKTGSTNMEGYKIDITPDGSATYAFSDPNNAGQGIVPQDVVQKLFADIENAQPFSQMGPMGCMKSVSFGTRTTVTYNGEQSGDVSCTSNPKSAAIYQDVRNVEQALGIVAVSRHRRPMAAPVPAPDSVTQ